jgi:hypothetical protein
VQDRDGFRTQLLVERLVVGIRELAGPVVEIGVADLPVLGLARCLELSELRGAGGRILGGWPPGWGPA